MNSIEKSINQNKKQYVFFNGKLNLYLCISYITILYNITMKLFEKN